MNKMLSLLLVASVLALVVVLRLRKSKNGGREAMNQVQEKGLWPVRATFIFAPNFLQRIQQTFNFYLVLDESFFETHEPNLLVGIPVKSTRKILSLLYFSGKFKKEKKNGFNVYEVEGFIGEEQTKNGTTYKFYVRGKNGKLLSTEISNVLYYKLKHLSERQKRFKMKEALISS